MTKNLLVSGTIFNKEIEKIIEMKKPPKGGYKKKSGDDLLSRSSHRNSTIGADGLNFSVRDGKRCFPVAIVTRNCICNKGLE